MIIGKDVMTEEGRNPVISVKAAGRMRRLATPKQWRSAIANGELTRVTPVTLERGPGRHAQMEAGEIKELSALFDELVGPVSAPPPPSAPPAPPPPPSPPLPVSGLIDDEAPAAPAPTVAVEEEEQTETFEEPAYFADPTPTVITDGSKTPLLIGGTLVLLLVVGFVLSNRSGDSAASDAAEEAMLPADSQYSQRFWAPRDLPIRASRSDAALESGQLARGDQVLTTPPADGWVQLANGGFVRVDDLLTTAPPQIDRSTGNDYFTVEPVDVLDAPNTGASSIMLIDKMERVKVIGTVNSAFAEILTDTGKVGYVNWESFGGIGGKGRSAWIAVNNRCNTTKNVAFSLTVNGVRTAHVGYWTFAPGFNSALEYSKSSGQRIYVDSVFNFFADLGDDFHFQGNHTVVQEGDDKVRVNGKLVEMKRMVAELTPDDAYQITFC